jgi:hypothetical protein
MMSSAIDNVASCEICAATSIHDEQLTEGYFPNSSSSLLSIRIQSLQQLLLPVHCVRNCNTVKIKGKFGLALY